MKRVFWDNPYQTILSTKVSSVQEDEVTLEETIAFSFAGGQESDQGAINGYPILNSRIENNLIYYVISHEHGLCPGQAVTMEIDWPRRYRLMRLHFAAELVLEIVTKTYQLQKIGAHIGEDKARIDFVFDKNISTLFEALLTAYNAIIQADKPILTGFLDVALQRRYWKIDGFAEVPCGGTHVRSTREVGFITIRRVNIGAGKERIEIKLVDDSVASLQSSVT